MANLLEDFKAQLQSVLNEKAEYHQLSN